MCLESGITKKTIKKNIFNCVDHGIYTVLFSNCIQNLSSDRILGL